MTFQEMAWEFIEVFDELDVAQTNELLAKNVPIETLEFFGKYAEDFGIIHFDESGGVGHQAGADAMTHNTLKNAYSDHRPLWMRFQINAGQGDAISGGVDLTPPTAPAEYVATKSGKRFHRPNCSTIRRRATPRKWASRSEAATKLTPCSVCKP